MLFHSDVWYAWSRQRIENTAQPAGVLREPPVDKWDKEDEQKDAPHLGDKNRQPADRDGGRRGIWQWSKQKLDGFVSGVAQQSVATLFAIPLLIGLGAMIAESFKEPDRVTEYLPFTYFTWGAFYVNGYIIGAGVLLGEDEYFYYVAQPTQFAYPTGAWRMTYTAKLNEFSSVPNGIHMVEFAFGVGEQEKDRYFRHARVSYGSIKLDVDSDERRDAMTESLSGREWMYIYVHMESGIVPSPLISLEGSFDAIAHAQWLCRAIRY